MDKSEQVIRALKARENKKDNYIKIVVTLILFAILLTGHIICTCITFVERKVDYRYFNLVESLEQIHNVYIDTYDGKAYKTQEELKQAQEKRNKEDVKKRGFFKKYLKTFSN